MQSQAIRSLWKVHEMTKKEQIAAWKAVALEYREACEHAIYYMGDSQYESEHRNKADRMLELLQGGDR
jgi:hypothetical protein